MIKVIVNGALGRMGSEVVKTVIHQGDMKLVGVCDASERTEDAGVALNLGKILGFGISTDLEELIQKSSPDVMVDFTVPGVVMNNIRTAIKNKVIPVVGTTGITEENLAEIDGLCKKHRTGCLIAPNFATGAILLMKFAQEAARYFDNVEIIEYHHNRKEDYPSGTALKTAQMLAKSGKSFNQNVNDRVEKAAGARGADVNSIKVHSVRLPGFVAHEEVIFGGVGQALTLRHDSFSRESFMPGVALAIRKSKEIKGLVYGLENIL